MNENWCELCRHRQAELDAKRDRSPSVTAFGGWAMPSANMYALVADVGCFTWPDHSYRFYLQIHSWWRWKRAYRDWQDNQEFAGLMVHAFVPPVELPGISVRRGGLTYGGTA